MTSRCVVSVMLNTLFLLDVAASVFAAPAASPPITPAASLPTNPGAKAKAKGSGAALEPTSTKPVLLQPLLQPLQAPHVLVHYESLSDGQKSQADINAQFEADAKLARLNKGCPCAGQAATGGQTGCLCNMKWKNVWVDRAPTATLSSKSITLTTLVPTLVDLGTSMVPQDVSTIHVTEFPKIVATSMVPTSWPEFLGTTLIPQKRTTYEMRGMVLGTSIVPEWITQEGGRVQQQVPDCVNCGGGGFLQAAQKPTDGYGCCPHMTL